MAQRLRGSSVLAEKPRSSPSAHVSDLKLPVGLMPLRSVGTGTHMCILIPTYTELKINL